MRCVSQHHPFISLFSTNSSIVNSLVPLTGDPQIKQMVLLSALQVHMTFITGVISRLCVQLTWLMPRSSTSLNVPKGLGPRCFLSTNVPSAEHWAWSKAGSHGSLLHEWCTDVNIQYMTVLGRELRSGCWSAPALFKESSFEVRQIWGPVFTLPCASCVTLSKMNLLRGLFSSSVR